MEVSLVHRLTRALLAVAMVALVALGAPRARADAQQDARMFFDRGVEATRAQRWQEARILFERSLALVVKPSTLLNIAISHVKLGHGAEALEKLDALAQVANPNDHGMIEWARVLRAQAQALIDNETATARHGGQALSEERARDEEGLNDAARHEVSLAREAFARGDDREALAAFERAYKESPRAELLYNIGVVADRLRDDERAVRAYDEFAAALPNAPETAVAHVRSAALRAALAERQLDAQKAAAEKQQAAPPARAPVALPPPPNLWPARAVLITGGALGGLAIGALGWYLERSNKVRACEAHEHPPALEHGCDEENYKTIRQQRDQLLIATATLGGAAVAVTTAGAIWLVQLKRKGRQQAWLDLTPQVGLGAGAPYGFTWSGRF